MNNRHKYKILLADDEPRNIKDLLEALNPGNYRMFVSSHWRRSFEQALKRQADAIIVDGMMPKSQGIEAIKIIMNNSIRKMNLAL